MLSFPNSLRVNQELIEPVFNYLFVSCDEIKNRTFNFDNWKIFQNYFGYV